MKIVSKFTFFIAVIALLIFLNVTSLGKLIQGKTLSLVKFPFSRLLRISYIFKDYKGYFASRDKLLLENAQLQAELRNREEETVALEKSLDGVKAQEVVHAFAAQRGFTLVSSMVLAKTGSDSMLSFILDKGARDGLAEGQVVITGDGALLGKIIKVENEFSIFRFLTDQNSRFTAGILGQAGVAGEVRGNLGLGLNLELIPREFLIKPDDLVVTAGLEEGVPQGLLIGKILQVSRDEQNPLEQARVQGAANLNELQHVAIITQVYK